MCVSADLIGKVNYNRQSFGHNVLVRREHSQHDVTHLFVVAHV